MHLEQMINFQNKTSILVDIFYDSSNKNTVILLPALGVPLSKYQKLIEILCENKINIICADYPGCGRNTPSVSKNFDYGYLDLLHDFIPALHQIAIEKNMPSLTIFGHSLGGHLATLYAQQKTIKVIGIATGNIGLKYWNALGKINILKVATIIKLMILKDGYFAGYKIGFGYKEAKTLMRDWSKTIFTGNYSHILKIDSISSNQALFISLEKDDFAPLSSTLGLSQYFKNPQILALDLSTQIKGNQHSAWIKKPNEVVEKITHWLNDQK